jgi:hypothetical protein
MSKKKTQKKRHKSSGPATMPAPHLLKDLDEALAAVEKEMVEKVMDSVGKDLARRRPA